MHTDKKNADPLRTGDKILVVGIEFYELVFRHWMSVDISLNAVYAYIGKQRSFS